MTSESSASNRVDDRYPLFTDLKFTIGCPRQSGDDECGICVQDVRDQRTLTHDNGACKIAYCVDCWEKHFERSVRCPNCRGTLAFDQTINTRSLTGKTRQVSGQSWLIQMRLRDRYKHYDMTPPYPISRIVQEVYEMRRPQDQLYPDDFTSFFSHQGSWSYSQVLFSNFFIDLLWAFEAISQELDLDRLHTHPNLVQAIFQSSGDRLSPWSLVEAEFASSEIEQIRVVIRAWARFNAQLMKINQFWNGLQTNLETRYLVDEANYAAMSADDEMSDEDA